ncbi:rhomboid family intramembrane serine protease [Myxococcota bacterium]|nr:rhomboid family intramembrane serine protease [Myxococcota bacterium]
MVSSTDAEHDARRIRLAKGGAILFEETGFRLSAPRGLRRSPLHPYASITHVCLAARALLIGTTGGLLVVRNGDFADVANGPAQARESLIHRVALRPDGAEQLRALARVEAIASRKAQLGVLWTTVVLCLIGTALQLREPLLDQFGSFVPELFGRGELWRGITAHFLHALPAEPGRIERWIPGLRGLPIHLAINVGGLFVLGPLVERPLGGWRTVLVLLAGGLGTVAGVLVAGHWEVIGASGLVAALAGAILALELHHPASIPAEWRLPRRLFVVAVVLQFGLIDPLMRSFIAGGAHLGGFVGGYLAAWWLGVAEVGPDPSIGRLRFLAQAGIVSAAALSLGIVPLLRQDPAALERHAARLLDCPASFHLYLHENAAAWLIATGRDPSPRAVELAIELADRAVVTTERMHPGVLDTLAEALFQSGDRFGALLTIEEAIRLAPAERYFVEQRRRFTGERAANDRPPQPGEGDPREPDPEWIPGAEPHDPDAPRMTL